MKIYHAIIRVPNRSKVQDALATLGDCPPSYQDFLDAIKSSPGTTASGSSGLTYAMMKAWPEEVSRLAYDLLAKMWGAKHVPDWWKFRWLAPHSPLRLMSYGFLEVLRKCWTGMIVKRIMNVIEDQGVLSESQHAFRRGRGTYTANLQLNNAMETAWQRRDGRRSMGPPGTSKRPSIQSARQ